MTDLDRTIRYGSFQLTKPLAIGMAALFLTTVLAYIPAMHAGYIWDDDSYVTENELLRNLEGLGRIWIPSETPQYYPLVFSTFWLEYQIWELKPMGYHVTNILLHAVSALLLWIVMIRLRVPGAWLIASVFALHPVMVESVAWITERKNVLSMCFYLLSALAYFYFDEMRFGRKGDISSQEQGVLHSHSWGWYAAAFVLFVCALLSKTVTCSLPAALILVMVWLRTPMTAKRLAPLIPFFIIGFILAMNTAGLEQEHVGAVGEDFDFTFIERCLIASKCLLFYPWKLLWPAELMFIYPRWEIDATDPIQYIPLAACLAIGIACVFAFSRGWRGPFIALAFYAGTVFPAIGFFNVYPHLFSFVADHFVYHASIGFIAFIVGGLAYLLRNGVPLRIIAAVILPTLFALTWMQTTIYEDEETVWRDTIARNPDAWMPRNNLASLLLQEADRALADGRHDRVHELAHEAHYHAEEALRVRPHHHTAHSNRSEALRLLGEYDEALAAIERAIDEAPHMVDYIWQRGRLLELMNRPDEAIHAYDEALGLAPESLALRSDLARVLLRTDQLEEAANVLQELLSLQPGHAMSLASLASIRERQGRYGAAHRYYGMAVESANTLEEFATIVARAVRFWTQVPEEEYRYVERARRYAERLAELTQYADPSVLAMLATVYHAADEPDDAQRYAQQAVFLAQQYGMDDLAAQLQHELRHILQPAE